MLRCRCRHRLVPFAFGRRGQTGKTRQPQANNRGGGNEDDRGLGCCSRHQQDDAMRCDTMRVRLGVVAVRLVIYLRLLFYCWLAGVHKWNKHQKRAR